MGLLTKVTSIVIALIIVFAGSLYILNTSKAANRTGVIKSLSVKKAHKTNNIYNITLTTGESIVFDFEEISPLFDVQRFLALRSDTHIEYSVSQKNEVLGIKNLNDQQRISPAFYIINKVMSNIFVYLALMLLTLVQLGYIFYHYSFARKSTSNDRMIDRINRLFKKYVILIPLLFFLFFYLLYKFSHHLNALVEPVVEFEAGKYMLNFIVFWFLAILLLINVLIEKKLRKVY